MSKPRPLLPRDPTKQLMNALSSPPTHTPLPRLLVLKWLPQSLCWDGCCKGCSIFQWLHYIRRQTHFYMPGAQVKTTTKAKPAKQEKDPSTHTHPESKRCTGSYHQVTTLRSFGNSPSSFPSPSSPKKQPKCRAGHGLICRKKTTAESTKTRGRL